MNKLRMKINNIVNYFIYILPLLATAFIAQEANGQFFPIPPKVINPFTSFDTTAVARAYSANNGLSLEDITARNNMADIRVKSDRTHTITGGPGIDWNCQHWTLLHLVNAYDWGDGVYNVGGAKLLYNGYKGWDSAQIYANGGTLIDQGKMGLPLFRIEFILDPNTREAHTQTALLSGIHALVGNNWNYIEPRDGITQVKPGQLNIPLNTDEFIISYNFVGKTDLHEKVLAAVPILKFKIVNGEMILTYNINDDPLYNQRIHLITERENDAPIINVNQGTAADSLVLNINEVNPRSQYLIIDDGTPIPITTNEKRKLNLTAGTHNITVQADDYFNLKSQITFQRTITAPVNNPPIIKFITPTNGQKYITSPYLEYLVTDTDLNTVTYSVNNGSKITINPSGKIPLNLTNGQYKIIIEATDKKPQTAKDSVSFEVNIPVEKENLIVYPNPTENNYINIRGSLPARGTTTTTIYGMNGQKIREIRNGATTETIEERIELGDMAKGIYFMKIETTGTDGQIYTTKKKIIK
jgi:hypothetical protein